MKKKYLKKSDVSELHKGKGCQVCNQTGYFGRTLVYEMLTVDRDLALMIEKEADINELADQARQSGYVDIFDICVKKILAGITTTEEALRILGHVRRK